MAAFNVARFHADYDDRPDVRIGLFEALTQHIEPESVLYPGSYVDIAASVVFDQVTYVDTDKRAARFFSKDEALGDLIRSKRSDPDTQFAYSFLRADYCEPLDLPDGSHELLVSLYAGFVSEHCSRYLAPGGWLLANDSHGDASMASIGAEFELVAVIDSRSGSYRVNTTGLDDHLVPKRGDAPTVDSLHTSGRGVAYTRSPYAYLFRKEPSRA